MKSPTHLFTAETDFEAEPQTSTRAAPPAQPSTIIATRAPRPHDDTGGAGQPLNRGATGGACVNDGKNERYPHPKKQKDALSPLLESY